MHGIAQIFTNVLHPLAVAAAWLAGRFATEMGTTSEHATFGLAALIVSTGVVVIASALWVGAERVRHALTCRKLRADLTDAKASLLSREALLTAGWDAIAVFGKNIGEPLNFGRGSELLQAALAGPDAGYLAKLVDALLIDGNSFKSLARSKGGRRIAFRGQTVGPSAAVFAHIEKLQTSDELDYRDLLDAIPTPAWIRDRNLRLKWANRAFLALSGDATLEAAIAAGRVIERSELELCGSVLDNHAAISTRRYTTIDGQRHALDLQIKELDHGSIVGVATDATELTKSEARLLAERDAQRDVIDQLSPAIAVFGPDRRLAQSNRSFAERFALAESWLDTYPSMDEILDSLRARNRLPEQRQFAVWKRQLLDLFNDPQTDTTEVWHMPNGRSERMSCHPHATGGLIFVFEDITEELEIKSSYNTLVKVQKATLDTMDEAIAVFGPDGKLKLHNRAFGQLWQLEEADLANEPHVRILAEMCGSRIGMDESWSIVIAGVNAADPEKYNAWSTVTRADGKIVTLSLTRLPDGATMVTFSDVTDYLRFETMLRNGARSAA